ncbi:cobaltochelatase subunit CobN [Marinivivus vitaminiproducens]|uniref:cobaltochelatase subunit CobN n=1 Tax=Marinivivus vitaminiproducens TaxID=3035935 RepID=UPI0027AA2F5F|nr:cobaltochelatase subunit CobN [Geminicoccaceae bacterium SCSIO 64248]
MHLLNARTERALEGEAQDLGQTPGDIVVLSSADTELAALAAAQADRPPGAPSLRLANLLQLGHPLSIDVHVERVIRHARLVVLRLLGGRSYWPYGLEQVAAACRASGVPLAALPGCDRPDPELAEWSTVPTETCWRLWQYLVQGGPANAAAFLDFAASLTGAASDAPPPRSFVRAGHYLPKRGVVDLDDVRRNWRDERPRAALVFYRALVQAGDLAAIDSLIEALDAAGIDALPTFVTSLKDPAAIALIERSFAEASPDIVLNTTGFALGAGDDPLVGTAGRMVLQVVLSGAQETAWRSGLRGLAPRDLAMHVALPETDGRVLTRAISFKEGARFDEATECRLDRHAPVPDRVAFVAALAAGWIRLARTPKAQRRIALVLANYPSRDGRIANGVGLDTPQSAVRILRSLASEGYGIEGGPEDGAELIARLIEGPSNARAHRPAVVRYPLSLYRKHYNALPPCVRAAIEERWGPPEADPHLRSGAFPLAVLPLGHAVTAIQPARGYQIDPTATYHSPDLMPPHHYLAFYAWLRRDFGAHAVVHVGKHGNLEWLPGKALALSAECLPEIALGPMPHVYPFIVNDPGEGSQAKRRTAAVIVDHLTPPLTRAESYGALRDLEQRVDEYYEAAALDPKRAALLRREILELGRSLGLERDLGLEGGDEDARLAAFDNHLCELKELQIRDGLHVFGEAPETGLMTDLLLALVRIGRGRGEGGDASLPRALAADLGLDGFDPLAAELAAPWTGARPEPLADVSGDAWRTAGDTIERLELLGRSLIAGERPAAAAGPASRAVLERIERSLRPAVAGCGDAEMSGLLKALDGRFLAPGPSGAPTRGRPDVLPTGRNFYSVDSRAVPTPAAWQLGWTSAATLIDRYVQEQGDWPRTIALSAWGTANMRTGGDDIAQALALMGVRPVWDDASHRVTGIEVMPLALLGRPRIDVTMRISGFFRDAFPAQVDLLDQAVQAVAALDEPAEDNPLAATVRLDQERHRAAGLDEEAARRRATFRVYGSKPGAYGAGLQALIDERGWQSSEDLARAFLAWGGYAYGRGVDGQADHAGFATRLGAVELVLHNQDNQEHDILDSDEYYQFEGGLAAAVRAEAGHAPIIYHNDHSRPEHPRVRPLQEEIGRIVRGRAANPKWLNGVMRHGYKGAFEIAATVDYLFGYAATTGLEMDHHFDTLYRAYVEDEAVTAFMALHNKAALREMAERFAEARERGLWRAPDNRAAGRLAALAAA